VSDQPGSWQEVFEEFLPETEVAELAQRIGSQLPAADFRLAIRNVVAFAFSVAISNPRPWQEQKRGLQEVAKRARKAAASVRELHEAFDDSRWVHSTQQLMDSTGWSAPDLPALAAQLENLALPAKAMAKARKIPRYEVFAIFVQLAAGLFAMATGQPPKFTFNNYHLEGERYTGPFIELLETIWPRILAIGKLAGTSIEGPPTNVARGKFAQRVMDKV
jgi:hypothetical protein